MYERERVTPQLLDRHLRELQASLALIHRLVYETPYQPGDAWVSGLALDEGRAAVAAQQLTRAGVINGKPSVLELYTAHVSQLIARVPRPAEPAAPNAGPAKSTEPAPVAPSEPAAIGNSAADDASSRAANLDELLAAPAPAGPAGAPSPAEATTPAPEPAAPATPSTPVPSGVPNGSVRYISVLAALAQSDPTLGNVQERFDRARQQAVALANAEANLESLRSGGLSNTSQLKQAESEIARLRDQFTQLKRDLEAGRTTAVGDASAHVIVRDCVTVTSVAMRIALEAASLATVAMAEVVTLLGQSRTSWITNAPGMASLASTVPVQVRALASQLESDGEALKALVNALSRLESIDPEATAGYYLKDGLVDEIVGFTLDSVHATADAGGEALFYNALANAEKSSGRGTTYDYTGRSYKLNYHVDPIVLASARLAATVDWTRLPKFAGLRLGYSTNRVYRSGGELTDTTLTNALGVSNSFSDVLDAALFVAGVTASARIAHFTSGTVDLVQIADGSLLAQAPFTFSMKQIDLGYDLAPRGQSLLQTMMLTVGYFDYTLPRILYEFDNITPGASNATYVYSRETPPQAVRTRLGVLGAAMRMEQQLQRGFSTFLALGGALGAGPVSYYFLKDTTLPDEESNRARTKSMNVGANVGGTFGVRWRFVGEDSRFSAHLDAAYTGQFIFSQLNSNSSGDKAINSGSNDVFHGPRAAVGGAF